EAWARRLQMIEETLQDAPRFRPTVTSQLPGHSFARTDPIGPLDSAEALTEDAAHDFLERLAAGDVGKGARRRLAMIGQHVEVVAALGQSLCDPQELADGVVDVMQGTEGGRMRRPESVREHVVVEEVHVNGGNAAVEIGGHAEGKELSQPDRE